MLLISTVIVAISFDLCQTEGFTVKFICESGTAFGVVEEEYENMKMSRRNAEAQRERWSYLRFAREFIIINA
jgi:hypothetical protein